MLAIIKTPHQSFTSFRMVRGRPAANNMIQLVIIKTGGKQYLVSPGQRIKIEKIEVKEDSEIIFDEVLLLEKGRKLEIGTPLVKGAKVIGKILKQGKGKKLIVFKYKPKTRYKVKKGHRQPFTEVEILKIETH